MVASVYDRGQVFFRGLQSWLFGSPDARTWRPAVVGRLGVLRRPGAGLIRATWGRSRSRRGASERPWGTFWGAGTVRQSRRAKGTPHQHWRVRLVGRGRGYSSWRCRGSASRRRIRSGSSQGAAQEERMKAMAPRTPSSRYSSRRWRARRARALNRWARCIR